MSFTTTWLEPKFRHLFLLFVVVLLTTACRREESNLDLKTKDQDYQIGSYYTDTITVKASTSYVQDSVVSTTAFLMCGAFQDPDFGKVWSNAYTQIRLTRENIDYTGSTVTSTILRLDYSYAYGDTLQDQIFDVYAMPSTIDVNTTYYTITPSPDLSGLSPIGTITFQARPNVEGAYIDIPLDNAYGQQILAASNTNNDNFVNNIKGLAIIPRDRDKGAVLQINFSDQTKLMVNYTSSGGDPYQELYSINTNSARYFTSEFDRSGTILSSLTNDYDESPSSSTGGRLFIQSMTGLKLKVSFPYIKEFLKQAGSNVLVNKALLYLPLESSSLAGPYGVVMIMTDENGKLIKSSDNSGTYRVVQNDYSSAIGTSSNQIIIIDDNNASYTGRLSSYFLANQLNQLPYDRPLFVSSIYNSAEVNRAVISESGLKLKVYYSILK